MSCEKCTVTQCKACQEKDSKAFDGWLDDLETKEQPKACEINDPDCDNCGS
jgi:hypothetical protein|tara:strand:- start:3727 stop:3879 length:153 start_codon:yes stop_codon:yes gene_type:complete